MMDRRDALKTLAAVAVPSRLAAAAPAVSTVIGTGVAGDSRRPGQQPVRPAIGPGRRALLLRPRQPAHPPPRSHDAAHHDRRRQRPARLRGRRRTGDATPRSTCRTRSSSTRPATSTSPNATATSCARWMRRPGVISTLAGTGVAGFAGDGGPAAEAQLRQPHSIVFDAARGGCSSATSATTACGVCDLATGTIDTFGWHRRAGSRRQTARRSPARR